MAEEIELPEWLLMDPAELKFIGDSAGFDTVIRGEDQMGPKDSLIPTVESMKELLEAITATIITEGPDEFCKFIEFNKMDILEYAHYYEDIARAVIDGYKLGISQQSGACANDLGARYYNGELVEQDYQKAAELYDMAIAWGCDQSIINMGYIYEYGRTGEPDYAKAYEYYALACALTESSEALYKLGDMYSRGKSVKRDIAKAARLWQRSMMAAESPEMNAQAAIRLAPLFLEGCEEAGIENNAMVALRLYLDAEMGLRLDIENGQSYYQKRLDQALEGQQKARLLLDAKRAINDVFFE